MTPAATSFEFSTEHNATIGAAGSRARLWGILSIVFGFVQVLAGLTMLGKGGGLMAIGQLAGGPVSLAIGVTILGVASAFKQVVETKGSDVPHMMAALQKLTTAYTIQIVVLVVSFTGGFIAGALGYR